MATERIQIAVRLESWIIEAVKKFTKRNKKDFSWSLRFLLECELNNRGYFRTDYEPDIIDYEVANDIRNPNETPSDKEKKLEFEVKSKEMEIERLKKKLEDAGITEKQHIATNNFGNNEKKVI